jgi:hypothetical protein
MGTDIHVFIQIFNGTWKLIKMVIDPSNPSHNRYCMGFNVNNCNFDIVNYQKCNCNDDCECIDDFLQEIDFDLSRDYQSFAKLAYVRYRNDDIECQLPKGWPEIDDNLYHLTNDLHSNTYFTDVEIEAFTEKYQVINEMKMLLEKVKAKYNCPIRFLIAFDS